MGTVHAKSENSPFEETGMYDNFLDSQEEPNKPSIKLEGVRARVDRIHVDGLSRTKDDIIRSTVNDLFQATDFEDVVVRAHRIRSKLDSMGCFRDIGIFIDVSSGPGSTPEGLEVTFQVKEMNRIVGGVNTTVGENEGNIVLGMKMPNVLGRGERLQAEYSVGYRNNSNFSITANKPFPHKPLSPVFSASVFQQNHQYPWSGYRQLDRGLLLEMACKTSPATKHSVQWEGLVRDTSVLSKTASFKVRESSGPQMKSAIRHIVGVDHRDDPIFPNSGSFVQFTNELSGLGGSVAFLKNELFAQHNLTVRPDVVIQASCQLGVLHDMFGTDLTEHFYLGGPTSLRGFQQRGVGPHSDGSATGGRVYWATGLHLFTPLPFRPGKDGLGELFRTHLFLNAGCLSPPSESVQTILEEGVANARVSCGAGVALRLGRIARLELNYCAPLVVHANDITAPGLQFGVGINFL